MQVNAGFHPLLFCNDKELVHRDKQWVAPVLQSENHCSTVPEELADDVIKS